MAKAKKPLEERILAACKSAKTKSDIATRVGASYAHVARAINGLVEDGKLVVAGAVKPSIGRPAPKFKVAA